MRISIRVRSHEEHLYLNPTVFFFDFFVLIELLEFLVSVQFLDRCPRNLRYCRSIVRRSLRPVVMPLPFWVSLTILNVWFVSDLSGQLEKAFESTPYQDTRLMADNITQFLKEMSLLDASSGFTSLYVAMVQSSGSGKTRFALEIPRLLRSSRVAYLCLRHYGSSGSVVLSHFLKLTANLRFNSFLPCSRRRLSSSE